MAIVILTVCLLPGCSETARDGYMQAMKDQGVPENIAERAADELEKSGDFEGIPYEESYKAAEKAATEQKYFYKEEPSLDTPEPSYETDMINEPIKPDKTPNNKETEVELHIAEDLHQLSTYNKETLERDFNTYSINLGYSEIYLKKTYSDELDYYESDFEKYAHVTAGFNAEGRCYYFELTAKAGLFPADTLKDFRYIVADIIYGPDNPPNKDYKLGEVRSEECYTSDGFIYNFCYSDKNNIVHMGAFANTDILYLVRGYQ